MDQNKLKEIKDCLEELWNELDSIKDDVDDIINAPISEIEDKMYSKNGIYYRLINVLDNLYDVQKDVEELDKDDEI